MCIFSQSVKHVADTSIFGRVSKRGNQVLIYSMELDAAQDLAMILPLPVKAGTPEDGLTFVNLEKYPTLFKDVDKLFPSASAAPFGNAPGSIDSKPTLKLAVETVGNFEASFVPAMADFERLDERFRINPDAWKSLPQYANYGFAVFKLKAGKSRIHPMAFAFPTADPSKIFFPTVHIHDGKVHKQESFDHSLYCQSEASDVQMTWQESTQLISEHVALRSKKTILPFSHAYKKSMVGKFPNEDVWISAV